MGIGNVQQLFGIIIISACSINFQFDAKIAIAFAVENGVRLVAVFVNQVVLLSLILVAVTTVCLTVQIVGIVLV